MQYWYGPDCMSEGRQFFVELVRRVQDVLDGKLSTSWIMAGQPPDRASGVCMNLPRCLPTTPSQRPSLANRKLLDHQKTRTLFRVLKQDVTSTHRFPLPRTKILLRRHGKCRWTAIIAISVPRLWIVHRCSGSGTFHYLATPYQRRTLPWLLACHTYPTYPTPYISLHTW